MDSGSGFPAPSSASSRRCRGCASGLRLELPAPCLVAKKSQSEHVDGRLGVWNDPKPRFDLTTAILGDGHTGRQCEGEKGDDARVSRHGAFRTRSADFTHLRRFSLCQRPSLLKRLHQSADVLIDSQSRHPFTTATRSPRWTGLNISHQTILEITLRVGQRIHWSWTGLQPVAVKLGVLAAFRRAMGEVGQAGDSLFRAHRLAEAAFEQPCACVDRQSGQRPRQQGSHGQCPEQGQVGDQVVQQSSSSIGAKCIFSCTLDRLRAHGARKRERPPSKRGLRPF